MKRPFSRAERYTVWYCHEKKCWLCVEPLQLAEVTVDHVLPESLLDHDDLRQKLLAEYGLPKDFNINGYENWLPCHIRCNQKKGKKTPAFIPGNKMIFDRLWQKAREVERTARSVSSNVDKDIVFNTIFAALEAKRISVRDLLS
jgi:5-methylcytosine-specific restriction endonuclease McrA